MNESTQPAASANLAVLRGTVPNEPQVRDLAAGGVVVQFDIVTRIDTDGRGANVAVPIAWTDPSPTQLALLTVGVDLVVVGTVRRRFFRVGGATQSRTEVVADVVIPTRRRKQFAAALDAVIGRLCEVPV